MTLATFSAQIRWGKLDGIWDLSSLSKKQLLDLESRIPTDPEWDDKYNVVADELRKRGIQWRNID